MLFFVVSAIEAKYDFKEDFKHNTKCHFINPSKSKGEMVRPFYNGTPIKMGVVSKKFLEEINNKLNSHLCYNQWCTVWMVQSYRK